MHNLTVARILPPPTYPLLLLSDLLPRQLAPTLVSGGGLALGHEIRLGTLVFITDDSAWLQEAPLDVEALPVRWATHFRSCIHGVLIRMPSTLYRSTPVASSLPAVRRCKRSGRSRL